MPDATPQGEAMDVSDPTATETASADSSPTLSALPLDAIVSILAQLDCPIDLCRAARVSDTWRDAAGADLLWHHLGARRSDTWPSEGTHHCFRSRWVTWMDQFEVLTGSLSASLQLQLPERVAALSMGHASGPVECSSIARAVSSRGHDDASVKHFDFKMSVEFLCHLLEVGSRGPALAIDWLRTREAARSPVRALAVLATLHDMQFNTIELTSKYMSAAACDDARRRLLEEPWAPPASLGQRIAIKWSTWSQLRDCRGFRARDDVHRRTDTLLALSRQPEHEIWSVIRRGVANEVQTVSVAPAKADDMDEALTRPTRPPPTSGR